MTPAALLGARGHDRRDPRTPRAQLHRHGFSTVAQVQRELRGRATVVRLDGERPFEHGNEFGGDAREPVGQPAELTDRCALEHLRAGCAGPHGLTRQGVEGDGSKREHVTRRLGRASAGNGRVDVRGAAARRPVLAPDPRHAEIGEQRQADPREQHVARADVAVHDPFGVGVGKSGSDRRECRDHLARREPAARLQQIRQRTAVGKIEHQDDAVLGRNELVQMQQMWMIERRQQRGLGSGGLHQGRTRSIEPLQRHRLARGHGPPAPDLAGAAVAEQLLDDVARQFPCHSQQP